MSINSVLKKTLAKITKKKAQNNLFEVDVKESKEFLDDIIDPQNNFERSYAQYRCQAHILGKAYVFFTNVASFFLIILKLLTKNKLILKEERRAVYASFGIPDSVIPKVLRDEYPEMKTLSNYDKEYLTKEDKKFFFSLWKKYPFSFLFLLKCLIKMKMYSALIKEYSPEAIIVNNEFSYTSSFLTEYCEMRGITHINVMHGEKLFNLRDTFFHFHRCYIWNEGYKKLFNSLRAEETQYIIAVPPSILFEQEKIDNAQKTVDYTYYFQAPTEAEMTIVVEKLLQLAANGKKVAVRPHPRYTNASLLSSMIEGTPIEMEDYKTLSAVDSILRTNNVVSQFSTVLFQAYCNNINAVIDDVTNPKLTGMLKDLGFIMLECDHKMFSEILYEQSVQVCEKTN